LRSRRRGRSVLTPFKNVSRTVKPIALLVQLYFDEHGFLERRKDSSRSIDKGHFDGYEKVNGDSVTDITLPPSMP
jgi:hypothetical protein